MGGVCGHQQHPINSKSPPGSNQKSQYSYVSTEPMRFNIVFQNLKLQYPTKSCYILITLATEQLWETPNHIDLDGKHSWKRIIERQIQATIEELHSRLLGFQLFEDKQELANLNIPIYDIISGPQHFDYAIGKGRIQFDMQMAQILQIEITPLEIDCNFLDSIKDRAYVFNLRLVTRKMYFTSSNSSKFHNPAYIKQLNSSLNNFLQDMMYRTTWKQAEEIPVLSIELPSNELYNSSLQVCIWTMNKIDDYSSPNICSNRSLKEAPEREKIIIDQNLFAESFIALHKLIQEDQEEEFLLFNNFKTTLTKSLWLKGNKVGSMQSKFNVKIPKYLQQKLVGLRSENGHTISTNIILNANASGQIASIINVFQKLLEVIFKIQQLTHFDPYKGMYQQQALQIADSLLEEVQKSDRDFNSKIFYYKTPNELFKAQEAFIKIAAHLTRYVDKLDDKLREKYYEILGILIERGEFRLHSLGYFEDCKALTKKQLEQKNQVNLHYSEFMQSTLNQVLQKITIQTLQQNERKFTIRFLVLSYIRISEFQDPMLKCILKNADPSLGEWRATEFQLDGQEEHYNDQVAMIFDWQAYFYNYMSSIQHYQTIQIPQDTEWKEVFAERSIFFCQFIIEYCGYVQQIIQRTVIPWHMVPGYRGLLKAFLCELKLRHSYTTFFQDTLLAITNNNSLINMVVMILFNKTNIYQYDQVVQVLELISLIIQQSPQTVTVFDYPFFLNGIRIILTQSEHAISIATAIQLIYTNFLKFPLEFRKALIELLFEQISYNLFLHWSKTVRMAFMSFLLYRICHQYRNNKIAITDEEQFEEQYLLASKPRKNFSFYENRKEEKQLIADYIYLKYTRFMMNLEQIKLQLKQFPEYQDISLYQRMKKKIALQNPMTLDIQNIVIQEAKTGENQDQEEFQSEKMIVFERRNEFRNPSKKRTIIIMDQQYKYLKVALQEFAEITKQYTKWRYQSLTQGQDNLSPEEKNQEYLNFQVPSLKVLVHFDQKEGKQD